MRTPAEVFADYEGRRRGIIKALTTDVDRFWAQCDPNRENCSLYAYPEGAWAVELPAEEVPPEVPEPSLGINFARDGMPKRDWLGLVAVHSDAWLMALAFYKGARLNASEREELFKMINRLPTCYEVVSGKAKQHAQPAGPPAAQPAGAGGAKRPAQPQQPAGGAQRSAKASKPDYEEEEEEGNAWEDGEGDPCPECGKYYQQDEFWIMCDGCEQWYCGRCAKMTAAKAERVKKWLCGQCEG